MRNSRRVLMGISAWVMMLGIVGAEGAEVGVERYFKVPGEYVGAYGGYRSPLVFEDGRVVTDAGGWGERRKEILGRWHGIMGEWPALIEKPKFEYVETTRREDFIQHRVRVEIAAGRMVEGYLLVPEGKGPFPGVLVVFYDPETSVGLKAKGEFRDFAYELTKRGFVTLSIGSPGGDAWRPEIGGATCQPLSYLAYVAANCHTAMAGLGMVDPKRIGVMGHSYGGKWAMFASCLYEKFACAVWSDPGIVFDETRANVNYWEQWYLGYEAGKTRKAGIPSKENPRTGAYRRLVEEGHDLHELHALMAPRPFLVSGGSEDPVGRWEALNHTVAVNKVLGYSGRVGMTNRKEHSPNEESNGQVYGFLEWVLMGK